MNFAEKVLTKASMKLELPADILAGIPRIEILGNNQFSIEPHRGLYEYSNKRISVSSNIGTIVVSGDGIRIKCMNASRVTIEGEINMIHFWGMQDE